MRLSPGPCPWAAGSLNRDRSCNTAKGRLLGPHPCCLAAHTGGTSQSISSYVETGDGGAGGHRDAQGLFCCCNSMAQSSQSNGDGRGKAGTAGAQQHGLQEEAHQCTLPFSLHRDPRCALGTRAVWGGGEFT